MDEIESMLAEIETMHVLMKKQKNIADYKFALQTFIGFYTLYLMKIFYQTKGLYRPLKDIRATDLLLVMYTSAAVRFL